ncbi:MAPEG family protein [Aestuariivirga sp.]|uniref:MAPEG family protein n=1 Tax=Aestuariivirga sp. TaxID=2650926 RepID=UPI003593ADA8
MTQWLLLPAFAHVALVFFTGFRMGRARFSAARAGQVKVKDIAVDNSRWPEDVKKIANSYQNQFEVPMLYYALLPLLLVTGLADWMAVALSWVFVASRTVHAFIHQGSNNVLPRFRMFVFGFFIVVAMWAWFGLRLYVIG